MSSVVAVVIGTAGAVGPALGGALMQALSGRDAVLVCAAGVLLSILVVAGYFERAALIGCWALYLSLTTAGQDFMSFQWDILLLEAGFLAIFVAPLRLISTPARDPEPSRFALWMLRWVFPFWSD